MRPTTLRTVLTVACSVVISLGVALAASTGELESKFKKAVGAKDQEGASGALKELGALDTPEAARAIVTCTVEAAGALDVEPAALAALAGMQADASRKWLFNAVKNESGWPSRFLVVAALAQMGTPEAEDAVIAALSDKEPQVGAAAVGHLKRNASKTTVEKLIKALPALEKDKKFAPVRKEVSSALRDLVGVDIDSAQDWQNWWSTNGAAFELKKTAAAGKGGDDVVTRMRENHPSDFKTVERLSKDDLIVFHGGSDRIEQVLDALKLPYTKGDRSKFSEFKLDPKQVVVFACNGNKDSFTDDDIKKIREFVQAGGYIFTADWTVKSITEKVFPGKIEFLGKTPNGQDDTWNVKIRPTPQNATHPYNRDVFPIDPFERENFAWKIHGETYLVKIATDDPNVKVLIESQELSDKLADPGNKPKPKGRGNRGGKGGKGGKGGGEEGGDEGGSGGGTPAPSGKAPTPVAITYRFDSGRVATGPGADSGPSGGAVLHVLSHFEDQKTKEGDGFALQQLLLNFIVEKQKARAHAGS